MSAGRARLFIALDLPADAQAALVRWRSTVLLELPGLRPVSPQALHLTLCFLGGHELGEIDGIFAAARATACGFVLHGLSLGRAIWLPPRRPRVLAVSVNDPVSALASLQARLSEALQDGGWYAPESRPFRAHVTVARVGSGVRRGADVPRVRRGSDARARPSELPAPDPLAFDGAQVTLYRSRIGQEGASYEVLRTVALSAD